MTTPSLEQKVAKTIAEHYGMDPRIIERAGVVHLLRMSKPARKVILNESDRQLVKHRQAKRIAREQRKERMAAA